MKKNHYKIIKLMTHAGAWNRLKNPIYGYKVASNELLVDDNGMTLLGWGRRRNFTFGEGTEEQRVHQRRNSLLLLVLANQKLSCLRTRSKRGENHHENQRESG